MGGCAMFGGLLALLLPETLGSPLVESAADVDRMETTRAKPFLSWWSAERLRVALEENRSGLQQLDTPSPPSPPTP